MEGWIKLHRSVCDHWIWTNPRYFKWWVDLLMMARFEPKHMVFGRDLYKCNSGEIIVSYGYLAQRWRVNKSVVYYYFNLLEKDDMILRKSLKKMTQITICNYERYQESLNDERTSDERDENVERTWKEQNKECKRMKECKRVKKNTQLPNGIVCPKKSATTKEVLSFISFFNDRMEGHAIAQVESLLPSQEVALGNILRAYNPKEVEEVIVKAAESDFLNGGGNKGWVADLDWLLNMDNFKKILTGKYDDKKHGQNKRQINDGVERIASLDDELSKINAEYLARNSREDKDTENEVP